MPPYALCWTSNHLVAAGCDKKIILYSHEGVVFQQFDYFNDATEKEFTVMCCSPSGQAFAVGSFDRIRVYSWVARKNLWEENKAKEIEHLYSVTTIGWKKDGSRVAVGSLCGNFCNLCQTESFIHLHILGGVELFESVLKRAVWKNKFEMTYVGPSQVSIRSAKEDYLHACCLFLSFARFHFSEYIFCRLGLSEATDQGRSWRHLKVNLWLRD